MSPLSLALGGLLAAALAGDAPVDDAGAIDTSANPSSETGPLPETGPPPEGWSAAPLSTALLPPPPDFSFPAGLSARGHHAQAWLEYERLASTLPPGLAADRALYLAGDALLAQQREDVAARRRPGFEAAEHFADAAGRVTPASAPLLQLAEVEAHYEAERYPRAELRVAALTAPELAAERAYRIAWLRLRAGDPTAHVFFAEVPGQGPLALAGDQVAAELLALPPLPTRSPLAAGLLSAALPGAGQLYAGEPRDAFSALLLNGLFIGGTAALVQRRAWPAAALTGLFGLGFYTGNVVSAVNSVARRNRALEQARLDRLAADWELHLALVPAAPGEPLTHEVQLGGP